MTYSLVSACASSTFATPLACMSLPIRGTDIAIVRAPHSGTSLSKSDLLSDAGNCNTNSNDADGYCRSDSLAGWYSNALRML